MHIILKSFSLLLFMSILNLASCTKPYNIRFADNVNGVSTVTIHGNIIKYDDGIISLYSKANSSFMMFPMTYVEICSHTMDSMYLDTASIKDFSSTLELCESELFYFGDFSGKLHKSNEIDNRLCKSISYGSKFRGNSIYLDKWESLRVKKGTNRFKHVFNIMRPDSTLYKKLSLYFYKECNNNEPYFYANEPYESGLKYSFKLYDLDTLIDNDSLLFSKYKLEIIFENISNSRFQDTLSQIYIESFSITYLNYMDTIFQELSIDSSQNNQLIFHSNEILVPSTEDMIRIDFDIQVRNRISGFKHYRQRISQPILIIPPDHN